MAEFWDTFWSVFGSASLRDILQKTWIILLLITALLWGGRPERYAIGIWIIASAIAAYARTFFLPDETADQKWGTVNELMFANDCLMLVGFVVLAVQANRRYLFWVAGLQIIATLAHAVRATTEELSVFVYLLMSAGAGWLQLVVMTGGLIAHLRREKRRYPDWRWQVARPRTAHAVR